MKAFMKTMPDYSLNKIFSTMCHSDIGKSFQTRMIFKYSYYDETGQLKWVRAYRCK